MEINNDFSKLSNEVINYLGIKNTYFLLADGITSLVKPMYIAPQKWEIISASPLPEFGTLIIELRNNVKYSVLCSVSQLSNNFNSYLLMFENQLDQAFIDRLSKFHQITSASEKRRESRYNIGIENWKTFGLSKPEVQIVFDSKTYKCIINNVSVHGALLTGETASISQNGSMINFVCSFNDPAANVFQNALIVNCQNLQKNYSRYSLQFLDPVSFIWQERIQKFEEKQK